MKKSFKIAASCQDPGGCNAILPVVLKMRNEGHCVDLFASLYSANILEQKRIPFFKVSPEDFGSVKDILKRDRMDLFLMGTSLGFSLEDIFVETGKSLNIASLAVFDSWVNYAVRFCDSIDGNNLRYLPDYICVPDDLAKKEMENEGIPSVRIKVTGNPSFDNLLEEVNGIPVETRNFFFENYRLHPDAVIITFFSQRIDKTFGFSSADKKFLGFTQFDALSILYEALKIFYDINKVLLVIKPHPKENKDKFVEFLENNKGLRAVVLEDDARKILAISDMVAGISSVMLIEAHILGKKVLCIQPNLSSKDPFVLSRLDIIKRLNNKIAVLNQLKSYEYGKCKQDNLFRTGKATEKVMDIIFGLAEGNIYHSR